jgi:hypothetical protein
MSAKFVISPKAVWGDYQDVGCSAGCRLYAGLTFDPRPVLVVSDWIWPSRLVIGAIFGVGAYWAMNTNPDTEVLNLQLSAEPLSPILDWGKRIWRYMDLAKFVSMLQNHSLYFSVVAELGDDMEAACPRLTNGADPFQQQDAFGRWSLGRCINFASCWHLAEDESAAMWNIYAGRHQGIAVQSTLKALSSAFPAAEQEDANKILKIGFVDYIDPDGEELLPRFANMYAQVLRKRQWYAYENEMRLVCCPPDNWVEPVSINEPGRFRRSGVWVRCNLRELIQSVVVAPKAPPYLRAAVSEVFKRFEFDPAIVKSSRLNETVVPPNIDAYRAALRKLSTR